jgi:hypothetical protein
LKKRQKICGNIDLLVSKERPVNVKRDLLVSTETKYWSLFLRKRRPMRS